MGREGAGKKAARTLGPEGLRRRGANIARSRERNRRRRELLERLERMRQEKKQ